VSVRNTTLPPNFGALGQASARMSKKPKPRKAGLISSPKMGIAPKEARETIYWLRLARDTGMLGSKNAEDLLAQASSIQKILTSIVKTTSENP